MRMSQDRGISAAGQQLLDVIHDLRQTKVDVQIYVDHVTLKDYSETGEFLPEYGGGLGINLRSSDFLSAPPTVVLAHELGHAHAFWVKGWAADSWLANFIGVHNRAGLRAENWARQYYGCEPRDRHNTREPTCR
jgi:hypothetical protein